MKNLGTCEECRKQPAVEMKVIGRMRPTEGAANIGGKVLVCETCRELPKYLAQEVEKSDWFSRHRIGPAKPL